MYSIYTYCECNINDGEIRAHDLYVSMDGCLVCVWAPPCMPAILFSITSALSYILSHDIKNILSPNIEHPDISTQNHMCSVVHVACLLAKDVQCLPLTSTSSNMCMDVVPSH